MGSEPEGRKDRLAELAHIEEELKRDLQKARLEFEAVKATFELDYHAGHYIGLDHPDGAGALRIASQRYNAAVTRYSEALRRFTAFVTKGEIPKR